MQALDLHHLFQDERRRHQGSEETPFSDRHFNIAYDFFRGLCEEQGWAFSAVPLEEFSGNGFSDEVVELTWTLRELLQAAIKAANQEQEKTDGQET